jgi:hypothetical protein
MRKRILQGRFSKEFREEAAKLVAEENRRQAMEDITECDRHFYNRMRRQKRLCFLSPVAYRNKYFQAQLTA